MRGVGGGSQFFFDWNVILMIPQDHMQKFKILRQFLNFFTPQYVIVQGVGGGSTFFANFSEATIFNDPETIISSISFYFFVVKQDVFLNFNVLTKLSGWSNFCILHSLTL